MEPFDSSVRQIDILRIKNNQELHLKDDIMDEDILKIIINGEKCYEMVFSVTQPIFLAAGFLFTQDIVQKKPDILEMDFDKTTKECRMTISSGALDRLKRFKSTRPVKGSSGGSLLHDQGTGSPSLTKNTISVHYQQVLSLIRMHQEQSQLFQQTGAVHSAGLCHGNEIISFHEDIGRHNAVDKLAGDILLNDLDVTNKIATLSCRMSLEIVGKLVKTNIPIIISNAAPTQPAVELARKTGITMIGFARSSRFNIYTHAHRVKPDS